MVWLPARPSPMAAPTAPPPSARPPPIMAPASWMAWDWVSAIVVYLLWFPLADQLATVMSVHTGRLTSMNIGHGRVEVEDGEQGEDERLDGPDDEDVEELPDDAQDQVDDVADGEGAQLPGAEGGDQREHEGAGEQVAEEPERQGDGLGDLLDQVDEQVGRQEEDRERLGEVVLDVAVEAPGADRRDVDEHDDEEGHGQRQVDVGGGDDQEFVPGPHPEDLEGVADQDEHEQGDGQRDDGEAPGADGALDLLGDGLDARLVDDLQAAGDAAGGLPPDGEAEGEHDQHGHAGGPDDVPVDGEAEQLALDVVPDGDVGQQAVGR